MDQDLNKSQDELKTIGTSFFNLIMIFVGRFFYSTVQFGQLNFDIIKCGWGQLFANGRTISTYISLGILFGLVLLIFYVTMGRKKNMTNMA